MAEECKMDLKTQLKRIKQQQQSTTIQQKQVQDMTEEELSIYEKKLVKRLNYVHIYQQKLSDQKTKCIICKVNEKNVVLKGCNHLDLCDDCELKSSTNLCPTCFTEYDEIFIINL